MVYLIPLSLTVFGAYYFDIKKNKRGERILYNFLFIYLVFLIGFRFEVGGDTLMYMQDYIWRVDITEWQFSWTDYYEPLYTLLCALSKTVGDDFVYFQLLHIIILNSCLFYFISKSTEYRFSALFFCFIYYYLYFSTEILRESLAIFVFVLNYKNYEEGNWFKYYCGVCIAILFHISAVILIVFPFVKWLRFNWKYWIIMMLSIVVFSKLNTVFSLFADIEKISEKMAIYEDSSLVSGGILGAILTLLVCSRFTLLPIAIYLWDKKILKECPKYEGLICFYTLLGVGAWFNSVIFERFPNYITPLFFISLTNIIIPSFFKTATLSRKIMGIFFLCVTLIVYASFPARIYMRYIPYYSVFNPHSVVRIK